MDRIVLKRQVDRVTAARCIISFDAFPQPDFDYIHSINVVIAAGNDGGRKVDIKYDVQLQ